ncbi:MAG: metal ABC transporter substrate-binding protein [Bacteroidetes bacterium]|nr:metal ABC transporter substrate-binding protein [Bacteroidota bacterium]
MIRFKCLLITAVTCFVATSAFAQKKLSVVTTLTDLQQITQQIGGDKVEVISIATGYQNPHFVDPKPSHILKLAKADLFITSGLDLTTGWAPSLLASSRNSKIQSGSAGYVDTSVGVPLLNVPSSVSREQGDIHVFGNPHYWLDPFVGHIIAQNIYNGLIKLQPANKAYFAANLKAFNEALDAKIAGWKLKMKPFNGTKIVAFHDQWPYFETAFGLDIVAFLEPKPGIPPSPSQLAKVMNTMSSQSVSVIIMSPYEKADAANLVAGKVGGSVLHLATSVGAFREVKTYFDVFDYNVNLIVAALQKASH